MPDTPAHSQPTTHHYTTNYPAHGTRAGDPHYKDFEHFKKLHKPTARCAFAIEVDDDSECHGGLEVHHSVVEWSLQNNVDPDRLEHLFPGAANPDEIGAWVESDSNLVFLCEWHHRGHGGVHVAAYSDFESSKVVKGFIT